MAGRRKAPANCDPLILVINPGSTSTKLALFRGLGVIDQVSIEHSSQQLKKFSTQAQQQEFRYQALLTFLRQAQVDLDSLDAVVGRGGLLKPVPGGTYRVNALMKRHLRSCRFGRHASNLGGLLAAKIAVSSKCQTFVVDPVVVDELASAARFSGLPQLPRKSIFHALSQKAAARRACSEMGLSYHRCRLIVAHMGGGVSVGAHFRGKVVEVNNALDGDGPFAAERSGSLPAGDLVRLLGSGKITQDKMLKLITGRGGLVAHLGTNSLQEVADRISSGDKKAGQVLAALAYSISKSISGCLAALGDLPQAIVLTGGMCRCRPLVSQIRKHVKFLGPVKIYRENLEMKALAAGALRVLSGQEKARDYR
jgi:butyrate kinase